MPTDTDALLHCPVHGPNQTATMLCQHLVVEGSTGLGFHAPGRGRRPDAWCGPCEQIRAETGSFTRPVLRTLDPQVRCGGCYDAIRAVHADPLAAYARSWPGSRWTDWACLLLGTVTLGIPVALPDVPLGAAVFWFLAALLGGVLIPRLICYAVAQRIRTLQD